MDPQTTKKVVLEAPCKKCNNIERFSIKGCVVDCDKILAYFEKIFSDKESPCSRCGIPKLFKNSRERCVGCRLPTIYSDNQGIGAKSAMGRHWAPTKLPENRFYKKTYEK